MIITKAPEIRKLYLERIRDFVTGKREMPAVRYTDKRTQIHLSDVTSLCLLQPYYHRVTLNPPKMSYESAMRFLRGRVIERAIATEALPMEKDGIVCTVDNLEPFTEIKSTTEGSHEYKPEKEHPDWIKRMMGYCTVYEKKKMNLFVIFIAGNMINQLMYYWKKSKEKPKYSSIDADAWAVKFTPEELKANWEWTIETKRLLEDHVEMGVSIPKEIIDITKPDWVCKLCEWAPMCDYINGYE